MIKKKVNFDLPLRYVRYLRMSHEIQNKRSPDQQADTINRFLELQKRPWQCAYDDYRDDGVSGRLLRKRMDFAQLLDDIERGRIVVDLILVDTPERFCRAAQFAEIQRKLFEQYGVLVLAASNGFTDPTSDAGKALTMVESYRSTVEGQIKAHQVLRGKRDAARQGRWPGGPAPTGYKLESVLMDVNGVKEVSHKRLVVDDSRAWIIQEVYRIAHQKCWGGVRITKELNSRPEVVEAYGKELCEQTVSRWLVNSIYTGVLVFNCHSTDIIDDIRVIQRNPPEDFEIVKNFCPSVISAEVFDAVQKLREARSKKWNDPQQPTDEKLIRPLVNGVSLKYPLTGLIRCQVCGRSARPMRSGPLARSGSKYHYYFCPGGRDGSCTNKASVRGDHLWAAVVQHLRAHVLPREDPSVMPSWYARFCENIRSRLQPLLTPEQDRLPFLRAQMDDLQKQIEGWSKSLSNHSLAPELRSMIEKNCGEALAKQRQLSTEIAGLTPRELDWEAILNPTALRQRLDSLDTLLSEDNATATNVELAKHIYAIEFDQTGAVTMTATVFGFFGELADLVAAPVDAAVIARRLRRRQEPMKILSDIDDPILGEVTGRRPPELDAEWVWTAPLEIPTTVSWAKRHAAEVAKAKAEGLSNGQLAERFGRSKPTIAKALKHARESEAGKQTPPASSDAA